MTETAARAAGELTEPGAPASPSRRTARLSPQGVAVLFAALIVGLAAAVVLAVGVGAVKIPFSTSAGIIVHHLAPPLVEPGWTAIQDQIVWDFRLPRALLAVVVGAGLAVVGTVLQAVVRNPLADPYLLGVSSGASLGAVMVLVLGSAAAGGLSLSAAAFVGALIATGAVYLLAQRRRRVTPTRLILAGVAMSYLFQAGYSYLLLTAADPQGAQGVLFWLLGSLGAARWDLLAVPCAALAVGIGLMMTQARELNALLAGEDGATALGVDVHRLRVWLLVLTSLLTGVTVAVSGAAAFVGLIVPHFARLVVGSHHRRVLPIAALTGATFLVLVDLAARAARPPTELPLSIVTAVVGVPFFLWLLRRRDRSEQVATG